MILFVCSGNTCRSPLAQALGEKLGLVCASAGICAWPGAPATPEAQRAAAMHGCDLRNHRARPLTDELIDAAQIICPMTAAHAQAIAAQYPRAQRKIQLFSPEIPDPYGGGDAAYALCVSQLLQALDRLSVSNSCLRLWLGSYQTLPFSAVPVTDSTNRWVKEAARSGEISAPYLFLAGKQTAGRGRLGRVFISPEGTGLYMTLLLRPESFADATRLTLLAAISVCQAIEELTDLSPRIKWVNDIFIGGQKVCGILAEAIGNQVTVGIGVNLCTPSGGFPSEAGVAGALNRDILRGQLAAAITRRMLDGMAHLAQPTLLNEYRKRMPLIGQNISYQQNGQEKHARVTGVANDGGLIVEENGKTLILRTGEISLSSQAMQAVMAASAAPRP